jgi:uncharacterized membrane protein YqhA
MRALEHFFETVLWNSRFLILIAVVASILASLAMFAVAAVDVVRLGGDLIHYIAATGGAGEAAHRRAFIVTNVAEIIDGFLFAVVLLIFGLGLYELFISKIEAAENSEFASRLLLIRSLDDLKDRLAKVIFLILIVRYFEFALQHDIASSTDLLYLAVGIALVALALYLSRGKGGEADH